VRSPATTVNQCVTRCVVNAAPYVQPPSANQQTVVSVGNRPARLCRHPGVTGRHGNQVWGWGMLPRMCGSRRARRVGR